MAKWSECSGLVNPEGVSKMPGWGRGRGRGRGRGVSFFKEICFRVRVRVDTNLTLT